MKRILSRLLAFLLLLSILSSCGSREPAATAEADPGDPVASFVQKLRSGAFDGDKLYDYEDLSPYFSLGPYKGLSYPDDDYLRTEVTDQELEDYLIVLILTQALEESDFTQLTEGTVRKYDVVHIVTEGIIDGQSYKDASTGEDGADLVIGSGTSIAGFEEGLTGQAIGSTVTLHLTFSPYFGDETAAGKDVEFHITIESVRRAEIPDVTAAIINENFGTAFADVDSAREALRASMNQDRTEQAWSSLSVYLQNKIMASSTVNAYPEREVQHYRTYFEGLFQGYAESEGISLSDYLTERGYSAEEFEEDKDLYAKSSCELDLMSFSLARAEGITVSDDQIASLISGLYENSGDFSSVQELIDYYVSLYGPFYFENYILYRSVMEMVIKAAVKQ